MSIFRVRCFTPIIPKQFVSDLLGNRKVFYPEDFPMGGKHVIIFSAQAA